MTWTSMATKENQDLYCEHVPRGIFSFRVLGKCSEQNTATLPYLIHNAMSICINSLHKCECWILLFF